MQVPPSSAAANAASVTSQITNKDQPSGTRAQSAQKPSDQADIHVEHSGESDPDRDAQGQGDGLARDERGRQLADDEQPSNEPSAAATLPGEEPGELDIVG